MFLKQGDKTALVKSGKTVTYNELGKKVQLYSSLYKASETNKVGIFSENREGWVYSFYSAWNNNAMVVPVDFMSTVSEVAYILNDCKPEIVFVSAAKMADYQEAAKKLDYQPKVFTIEDYEDQNADRFSEFPIIEPQNEDDTAVVIYTSGTTGNPKGVMLSYANLLANMLGVSRDVKIYQADDRVMMLLPLHHIFGLVGNMILPMYMGAMAAIPPSMASDDIIKTLQDNKITLLLGVPRLYSAIHKGVKDKINKSKVAGALFSLAEKVNSKAFSKFVFGTVHKKFGGSIRFMVCGGAALDQVVGRDYKTLGFDVLEGYGMTEASPMITFTRPGHIKVGSPGFVLPKCDVEIRDGEIVAKGENIMKGYYNRSEETAEVLKDGWLYTGDLGHFDENGFLHITGRKKEILILSNGKNINPVEIETKLERYAAFVAEVGVYQSGDQFKAIVVPSHELKMQFKDAHELHQELKWKVFDVYNKGCSSYKKVTDFTVYDGELPRTRLGKIRRFKLAALELVDEVEEVAELKVESQEFNIISEYLTQEKGKKVLPQHHLEMDLGLDSLDKVSLQVFLKSSFGVDVDPSEQVRFKSVYDLSQYIHEHRSKMEVEKIDWTRILKEKVNLSLPKTWFTGRALVKLSKAFFSLYFGLKGKGLKNIPDEPCIIAPNHQSYFDGLFVASFLRNNVIKNTYFYAKEKHVNTRWLKFIANRHHVIVMDLNKDLKESIQKMGEALKKKKNLIIFPEGTRTKTGNIGDFKKTFAILSRELNVPIVPVSIKGAYDALPKGSKFPKPFKKVIVEFLEPVMPGAETYENISNAVHSKISKQLNVSRVRLGE
ncbi:AMP-binding protein [Saccharicrinis fermentans]|uniref:Long-chain-fatty-acid-CoA ligase FadD15 n=1 Tax=Saccharicrinis fermentans DSM 9555 = JCM 21142 TaxID=869213 RepID=W7YKW1_9BACT|nr:AMP-binding protein [Saccharicrinis fermentans]GAF02994.1 long-chain-fatty-acid-CoA ligase FadD15 [Saccharicrinis fermentans DSM 9555 = JCM 21142]